MATTNTPIVAAPPLCAMQLPAQSPYQLPVRTMSRLECAVFLYGDDGNHAAWECLLSGRPVHWIDPGWGTVQ